MKKIKLTQGQYTLVDDDDFELVNSFKWFSIKPGYIFYVVRHGKGTEIILLHRFITKCPKGKVVDHIDGNGLNNQRNNLRICSNAENCQNRGATKINKHGVKGVRWHKRDKKWEAYITKDRKRINLGYFKTQEQAKFAYNNASAKYHGKFGRSN